MSSAQIFQYLPDGIADGLGIDQDQVKMHSLVPWDTTSSYGYITTLAWAYVPASKVDSLYSSLHNPSSSLYTNSDGSVSTLMSYINPAISLTPGSQTQNGGASAGAGAGAAATSTTNSNGGVFNTDSQNTSTGTKSATAGIAFAAVGGAAAYGAAMFFIARRYKRKRSAHRRASSIQGMGENRYTRSSAGMGGAAVMSGGRGSYGTVGNGRGSRGSGLTGGTTRTAQISGPMMVENSLGWT